MSLSNTTAIKSMLLPLVLSFCRSVMKYNDPEYSGIADNTPPEEIAPEFIKLCWRHGKEPINNFKLLVSPKQYARIQDVFYIDSKESLEEFSTFIYGLGHNEISDWWKHKEMHHWIIPCIVKSQSRNPSRGPQLPVLSSMARVLRLPARVLSKINSVSTGDEMCTGVTCAVPEELLAKWQQPPAPSTSFKASRRYSPFCALRAPLPRAAAPPPHAENEDERTPERHEQDFVPPERAPRSGDRGWSVAPGDGRAAPEAPAGGTNSGLLARSSHVHVPARRTWLALAHARHRLGPEPEQPEQLQLHATHVGSKNCVLLQVGDSDYR
ncbi:hypothetical protein GGX14DRAFT_593301 [Mycena pura]|uniref:Uncharacterized protein n=1 Tax=Mycena pura TaxID=153505 RepID=A0AAD6Y3Y4_9AGAR|nr:hypothetical protein GGX14DRAFT_593301 [Mycena pura]